jgi:hypothetical protein
MVAVDEKAGGVKPGCEAKVHVDFRLKRGFRLPAVAGSQGPVCRRLETSLRPTRLFVHGRA